jgi:hypothetical protein
MAKKKEYKFGQKITIRGKKYFVTENRPRSFSASRIYWNDVTGTKLGSPQRFKKRRKR